MTDHIRLLLTGRTSQLGGSPKHLTRCGSCARLFVDTLDLLGADLVERLADAWITVDRSASTVTLEGARQAWRLQLGAASRAGGRQVEARALAVLGLIEHAIGNTAEARLIHGLAERTGAGVPAILASLISAADLGAICLRAADYPAARAHIDRAHRYAVELGDDRYQVRVLLLSAELAEAQGQLELARSSYAAALEPAGRAGYEVGVAVAQRGIAGVATALVPAAEAPDEWSWLLDRLLGDVERAGDTEADWLRLADELLGQLKRRAAKRPGGAGRLGAALRRGQETLSEALAESTPGAKIIPFPSTEASNLAWAQGFEFVAGTSHETGGSALILNRLRPIAFTWVRSPIIDRTGTVRLTLSFDPSLQELLAGEAQPSEHTRAAAPGSDQDLFVDVLDVFTGQLFELLDLATGEPAGVARVAPAERWHLTAPAGVELAFPLPDRDTPEFLSSLDAALTQYGGDEAQYPSARLAIRIWWRTPR